MSAPVPSDAALGLSHLCISWWSYSLGWGSLCFSVELPCDVSRAGAFTGIRSGACPGLAAGNQAGLQAAFSPPSLHYFGSKWHVHTPYVESAIQTPHSPSVRPTVLQTAKGGSYSLCWTLGLDVWLESPTP